MSEGITSVCYCFPRTDILSVVMDIASIPVLFLLILFINILIATYVCTYYVRMYVCMCMDKCHRAYVEIRGPFVRVGLSVHRVAPVDQTWVAKLGSRYLYLLTELVTLNPTFTE